ncbi:SOUL family heme-binding protein [Criblamydia sequanensis]|uniref:Heme-binding protein n=1 Tax=Candidatus Criblamydia sequanensis CRIB-18 TaxID=1437425 RepID=A0A090D034_9BACT|nr:heme-binding protein [Criblamydia sequanensis]CDR34822.1 Heme-binding protein [Criblamydia sequanensis CRIB-18]
MSHVEEPDYKLVAKHGNIEIRDYAPMILAEVEASGERKQAISNGFKILADYIFGNNTSKTKMDMTKPVSNELSEKMAMTAPVIQEKHLDKWKVRFVMPKKYSFETLPKPNSKDVVLIPLPARRFAVIRFSGLADNEAIKLNKDKLEAYIADQKLKPIGGTVLAFYNPPWTIPFLRRNEVMIELDSTVDSNSLETHP